MRLRKRLAAMLLAGVMTVSAIPAGVYAEGSEGEWTEEDTFNSLLYGGVTGGFDELYSDHAEVSYYPPVLSIDDRETSLGELTGNNSLSITPEQLKSDEYTDKVVLSFNFSFKDHLYLGDSVDYGVILVSSADNSFAATSLIIPIPASEQKAIYYAYVVCKKEDLQSGIVIRLISENSFNQYIRPENPLYFRNATICNIYNYEKNGELSGISGDLDALGSIAIPPSMLAGYPADNEERPGACLCFQYELKSDASDSVWFTYGFTANGLIDSNKPYDLIKITDRAKTDGINVKYQFDSHGAILKSVSVFLPVGVDYPEAGGYQSVGESIAALGTGKLSVQKTSVKDGKYNARFVRKVGADELSGKSKAVFSLSNGTKTASVSTDKYYTSLTADGEAISAESGTVFLAYTVKDIPENINITVSGVTLE